MLSGLVFVLSSLFFSTLAAPTARDALTVNTPIGTAHGVLDGSAVRFAVKYASAERWAQSTVASEWTFPNNASDPAAEPLACPSPILDDSQFSEDCLSMILYVPPTFNPSAQMPVFMWIHGGSFIIGSATDAGLDGSNLALATNSIVAVIQYRLGGFGFLAPDGTTNLAVRDVMNALKFLQQNVASFGGNPAQVTIAGQSSGATMVRALLAVPEAEPLFKQAILQSDPMDYGFLSPSTHQTLQSFFNTLIPCSTSDTSCLSSLDTLDILNAYMFTFQMAPTLDASAGAFSPLRPVRDGSLLTTALDLTSSPFPSQSKSIIVSTVLSEATPAIYGNFTSPLPESQFNQAVQDTFGLPRTNTIIGSTFYKASPPTNGDQASTLDARVQLESLGTDYLWKCSSWSFAREWVAAGGKAFVGMYVLGASYPGNTAVTSQCAQPGVVCHQDDIEIVFGTVDNPSAAQKTLVKEMQARYKGFLASGDVNAGTSPSVERWDAAGSVDVKAKVLGETGLVDVGSCDPGFWGKQVEYDYQVYGI
ncbi:hypothetical protein D9758_000858 [Tetrapyrgos nigripes]|uniref:Carboxylic ester hydrolase n=1 Tax=Tetrapyrgos nigripes TaxID=182062 RepID=A0A8H5LYC5_9AGAR|nr:hypothetical protein D9758_000858 [Tetrapyrgos nigripes]